METKLQKPYLMYYNLLIAQDLLYNIDNLIVKFS